MGDLLLTIGRNVWHLVTRLLNELIIIIVKRSVALPRIYLRTLILAYKCNRVTARPTRNEETMPQVSLEILPILCGLVIAMIAAALAEIYGRARVSGSMMAIVGYVSLYTSADSSISPTCFWTYVCI